MKQISGQRRPYVAEAESYFIRNFLIQFSLPSLCLKAVVVISDNIASAISMLMFKPFIMLDTLEQSRIENI